MAPVHPQSIVNAAAEGQTDAGDLRRPVLRRIRSILTHHLMYNDNRDEGEVVGSLQTPGSPQRHASALSLSEEVPGALEIMSPEGSEFYIAGRSISTGRSHVSFVDDVVPGEHSEVTSRRASMSESQEGRTSLTRVPVALDVCPQPQIL